MTSPMKLTAEVQPSGELFLFVQSGEDFQRLVETLPPTLRMQRADIEKKNIFLAYNIIAIYDQPETPTK